MWWLLGRRGRPHRHEGKSTWSWFRYWRVSNLLRLPEVRGSTLFYSSRRSVRIPSAFNGLYGLRPSFNRIPYEGSVNSMEGQDSVPSVLGPISNSLSGVKAFMKAVIGLKPWTRDPLAIRKAWDEEAYQLKEHGDGKDLCFAILWNNGVTTPTPPIHRALETAKRALEAQGFKGANNLLLLIPKHNKAVPRVVVDWPAFDYGDLCATLVRRSLSLKQFIC